MSEENQNDQHENLQPSNPSQQAPPPAATDYPCSEVAYGGYSGAIAEDLNLIFRSEVITRSLPASEGKHQLEGST